MSSQESSEPNLKFDKIDKTALLSLCPLFLKLDPWELESLARLTRVAEYKKDDFVYKQGDCPRSFYVVVSGRLEAYAEQGHGRQSLLCLRRGDYFGEASLLIEEPHTANVVVLSDSLLLELDKEGFKKAIENNAKLSLEISRRLSRRLKGKTFHTSLSAKSDIISVFNNQPNVGYGRFSVNLAASLARENKAKTILIDVSQSEQEFAIRWPGNPQAILSFFDSIESDLSQILPGFIKKHNSGFDVFTVIHQPGNLIEENSISVLLSHLAVDYRFIVVDLPGQVDPVVIQTLKQSDDLIFATDSNLNNLFEIREIIADIERCFVMPDEKISIAIHDTLFGMRATDELKKEFFGKKSCYLLPEVFEPEGPHGAWQTPFSLEKPEAAYSKTLSFLARKLGNNLIGLVLGSGAAMGLSHIGVLKVLESEKIPIDVIAGSSMGALVGALYCVGTPINEIEKVALGINNRWRLLQMLDIQSIPIRGLLGGAQVMKYFEKFWKKKTFEDCVIPLKIVVTDLSTFQIITVDSGPINQAVRASVSIPAIFKPVLKGDQVLIDGGILSPLPVGVLRKSGIRKIIAVNVYPTTDCISKNHQRKHKKEIKRAQRARQRGFFSYVSYLSRKKFARIFKANVFDVLMNTIQSMETEISKNEEKEANLVIKPVAGEAHWVEFYKARRFIEAGEAETLENISRIKALIHGQSQ